MDTKTLLKQIGGQAAIARECKISESAVSQWGDADSIPEARHMYLRLAHPGPHWDSYDQHKVIGKEGAPEVPQALVSIAQIATETVASGV